MAVEAEARGEFWTVPFELEGDRLEINGWTHFGGELRAGIVVEGEAGPEGFAVEDCDPATGDALWHTMTWRGSPDLSRLRGKTVRLHWQLLRGRLYAFRTQFGA